MMTFQALEDARKRLFAVLQERSRVLDLLCHANASIINSAKTERGRTSSLDGRVSIIDGSRFGAAAADALGPYTPETDQVSHNSLPEDFRMVFKMFAVRVLLRFFWQNLYVAYMENCVFRFLIHVSSIQIYVIRHVNQAGSRTVCLHGQKISMSDTT